MSAPAANSVSWFEIGAPDVDAAKAFYGPLFGWSFAPDGGYTLITAPGAGAPVRRHLQHRRQHPALRGLRRRRWTTWP